MGIVTALGEIFQSGNSKGKNLFFRTASASALYSVGLVTALYTGERERRCLVTP